MISLDSHSLVVSDTALALTYTHVNPVLYKPGTQPKTTNIYNDYIDSLPRLAL
jgi:hypothetical protein